MGRTYFRRTALAATALGLAGLGAGVPGLSRALFDSRPLQQERFAILAQAVGDSRWKLLVLEQIKARPLCWEERRDGLMKPSLNDFDFSGICSRYLDSNGYSLRTGGTDSDKRFRLKLEQNRDALMLQAMDPVRGDSTVVARATRVRRGKKAFVKMTLEPGGALGGRGPPGPTAEPCVFRQFQADAHAHGLESGQQPPEPQLLSESAQRSRTAAGRRQWPGKAGTDPTGSDSLPSLTLGQLRERPPRARHSWDHFLSCAGVRSAKRLFRVETRTDSCNAFHF